MGPENEQDWKGEGKEVGKVVGVPGTWVREVVVREGSAGCQLHQSSIGRAIGLRLRLR